MNGLELRVPPVIVVLICALLMRLTASWEQLLAFTLGRQLATAIGITAVIVVASGIWAFGRAQTTVDPTSPEKASRLVDRGVFSFSRNPMYVGFALGLVAWAIRLGSATALLLVVSFVIYLTRFQIIPEERALRTRFGAEYDRYCSRVRRWL